MLFGITLIIVLCGLIGLLIWWDTKKGTRESQEPLNDEVRNHHFVKAIFDITDRIRDLKKENEINSFLQEKAEGQINKPITELTPYSDYGNVSAMSIYALGVFGALLTTGNHNLSIKIDKIESIQTMWIYYLSRQFNKNNFSKEEWKKLNKDIQKKIAYLLNSKVLSLTNQKDIKSAWMIILKDKTLTNKVLNQLWGQVKRILIGNK